MKNPHPAKMAARKKTTKKKVRKKTKSSAKKEPKGTLEIQKDDTEKGNPWVWIALLAVLVVGLYIFAGDSHTPQDTTPLESIENGDVVRLKFTGSYENGTVFDTNYEELAQELGFVVLDETLDFTVGRADYLVGLHKAVVGMKQGEKKTVTLNPQEAYGERDPLFMLQWPEEVQRRKRAAIGRLLSVPKSEIAKVFNIDIVETTFVQGEKLYSEEYNVNYVVQGITDTDNVLLKIEAEEDDMIKLPNTPWDSEVWYVNETIMIAHQRPELGQQLELQWGNYEVSQVNDHDFILSSILEVGEHLTVNGKYGTITQKEGGVIYFDANHPLAGEKVIFEIEVVGVIKN